MAKVFTINGESNPKQIPSIEYIDELLKMIEDAIININKDFNGFPSIKTNIEEIKIENKPTTISCRDIKTDSNHRFINDAVLATLVNKPSKFEIEKSLSELKEEYRSEISDTYMKIINTPNVINKLRDIANMIDENNTMDGLLNILSEKVDDKKFKEHIESFNHLNNNDRKAINILIRCLTVGFADWNAEENSYNAIQNKPEALPANGGNADTISNHGIKELINKDDYDIVIGDSREKYSKDSCDIYTKDGVLTNKELQNNINSTGIVHFKRGNYNVDYLFLIYDHYMIFSGADNRLTKIKAKEAPIKMTNITIKDIGITDSKVIICHDCNIRNIRFYNCEITFYNSEYCNITDCIFDKCTFKVEGSMRNNIIKFNRYINTKPILYLGGNNIISENI